MFCILNILVVSSSIRYRLNVLSNLKCIECMIDGMIFFWFVYLEVCVLDLWMFYICILVGCEIF